MALSRSAQKRQRRQVERLAAGLAALPANLHAAMPCSEELAHQIRAAAGMKGGARQRQMKYVSKLLAASGQEEALARFLAQHQGRAAAEAHNLHQIESCRDALITEALALAAENGQGNPGETWSSQVLGELQATLPELDRRALLLLAGRFAATRDPRYSREIFRTFKAAFAAKERAAADRMPS